MRVGIYARVSTDDKEQDPERQLMKCRQYCELHNHEVLGEWKDYITGDSDPETRDGFKYLMNSNPEGIVVFSIDRYSRQHPLKIMRKLSEFKDKGIKMISITEPAFNMEGEMSDLLQYIITWFNNYFLRQLRINIKSGLDRARAQGKQIGRAKRDFNKFRAYTLLVVEKKSYRNVSKELSVPLATLYRFKKDAEKNPTPYKTLDACS